MPVSQKTWRRPMQFSIREFAYLGLVGALTLGLGVALGTGLTAATGIPMIGGLLNAVATAAVLTAGMKGVPRFGSGVVLWFVMSTLAIPTLTMGPPGVHKLLVGLISGLVWDVMFLLTGRKTWSYLVSGAVMMLTVMLSIYGAAVILGLPGEERLRQLIAYIIPVNFVLGLLGTWLGLMLFDRKLADIHFVRCMVEHRQFPSESALSTDADEANREA